MVSVEKATADPSADPGSVASPSLSVVITTRNRSRLVGGLLLSLLKEPGVSEIVVVNDGSTDDTHAVLTEIARGEPRVRLVSDGTANGIGSGAARARITGAQRAVGDVLWLLDDDVRPEPFAAQRHLLHHQDRQPRVVVGYMPTRIPETRTTATFSTTLYAQEYERRCAVYEANPGSVLENLWQGNISIDRETFLDATLRWPEPLPTFRHEDQILGLRLLELGVPALFDRSLASVHEHERSLAQFRRDCRLDGAGLAFLEERYASTREFVGLTQFMVSLPAPLAALVLVARRPYIYRAVARTLAVMVEGAGAIHMHSAQITLARILRRIELQHGYLEASRDP